MHSLDDLVGLQEVKQMVRSIVNRLRVLKKRDVNKDIEPGHYVFSGNPGTGKTTLARRMGAILKSLGILRKGHVVEVRRADLVSEFVGGTAQKTKEALKKAEHGILFIDEAYDLVRDDNDTFGKESLVELLAYMENHRNQLSIILAGYPNDMKQFLQRNVGFASRFPEKIHFPDFSAQELMTIFKDQANEANYKLTPPLHSLLNELFEFWLIDADLTFGNARDIRNLFGKMDRNQSNRLAPILDTLPENDPRLYELDIPDVPEKERSKLVEKPKTLESILDSLDDLTGLAQVKDSIRRITNQLRIDQIRNEGTELAAGHYIFSGNPGTGKTTIASRMGQIFRQLGLLKKGHVVSVGRSDLVAGYMGQTALKTREALERATEGILFIDEAYQLELDDRDSFGREAREELVAYMENNRGRFCLIAAGYPKPMEKFLASNPGLRSRFSGTLQFEDFTIPELMEIFYRMVESQKRVLGKELLKKLKTL